MRPLLADVYLLMLIVIEKDEKSSSVFPKALKCLGLLHNPMIFSLLSQKSKETRKYSLQGSWYQILLLFDLKELPIFFLEIGLGFIFIVLS